jgi:hypothetical protein
LSTHDADVSATLVLRWRRQRPAEPEAAVLGSAGPA